MLEIRDLRVSVDGKEVVKGVNLKISRGSVHALMGPNGSGKSSLAQAVMGHPSYKITGGKILLDGEDVSKMKPEERARKGLFLAFQYPLEIPGVNLANFVRAAHNSTKGVKQNSIQEVKDFRDKLKGEMKALGIREEFGLRSVNEGFSGGEKKRVEVLQLKMLSPKYAILDETDSGLDIDSLKTVSKAVDSVRGKTGLLVVTHYQRILRFVKPDFVHVMIEGKIALSGKGSLAAELEKKGYEWVKGKTRK